MSTHPSGNGGSSTVEEFQIPSDLISIQDRKEEALRVLKSEVMASLNKELKSMEEDNWMFEGPRSQIHLIASSGSFVNKKKEMGEKKPNGLPK